MRVRVHGDDHMPHHREEEPSMKKDTGPVPIPAALYANTVSQPTPLTASRKSFVPHAPYVPVKSDSTQPDWFVEVEYFAMPIVVNLLDVAEGDAVEITPEEAMDVCRRDLEEDIARAQSTASDLRAERDWLLARLTELTARQSDLVADISSVQESVRHLALSKALALKYFYTIYHASSNSLRLALWHEYAQLFENQQVCLAHMHAQMRQMISFGLFVDWLRAEVMTTSRRIAAREEEVWAIDWRVWELCRERVRVYTRSEEERKKRGKGKRAWARDARGVGSLRDEIDKAQLTVNKLRVQASRESTERYLRALFDTHLQSRRALKAGLALAEYDCKVYRGLYRGNLAKYQDDLNEMGPMEKEVKEMEEVLGAIMKEKQDVLEKIKAMQEATTPAITTPATESSPAASSSSTMPAGSSSTTSSTAPADPNAADAKRLLETRDMLMRMQPYDIVAMKREVENVKAKVAEARRKVYFGGQ